MFLQVPSKDMNLEKPLPSDCCGSGCTPCVFEIYEDHLQSMKKQQKKSNCSNGNILRKDLLSTTRFKPFRLIEKNKLSEDVFLLRFQAIENIRKEQNKISKISGILPYNIGQHLFLRCCLSKLSKSLIDKGIDKNNQPMSGTTEAMSKTGPEDSKIVIRAYTPITIAALEENCCFDVFVKFYINGTASNILNQSLVGDILYWRGPYGKFNYKPQSFRYILITCVGTGLAPMIPIINSVLNNELDETLVHLMFGVKNLNSIFLRDELRRMACFWNFTLEYYFSHSTESMESARFGETFIDRKIDITCIAEYLAGKKLENLLVLVCGTEAFSLDMKNVLYELGLDLNRNVHIFS